jgi:nucleoside-diphosphate-sugar epimerase
MLTLFEADLLIASSFKATLKGCSVVYHIASPFLIENKIRDSQKEVIKPALKGTQNVLDTVQKCETVRLIILTLSVVAISCDNTDILGIKNNTLSSEYFNSSSSATYNAYLYSKVITNKEA